MTVPLHSLRLIVVLLIADRDKLVDVGIRKPVPHRGSAVYLVNMTSADRHLPLILHFPVMQIQLTRRLQWRFQHLQLGANVVARHASGASYASAVLGVVILSVYLSVRPSVRHTRPF